MAKEETCENEENEDDELCSTCAGSGEGMYAGGSCRSCGGSGEYYVTVCEYCEKSLNSGSSKTRVHRGCFKAAQAEYRGDV